MVGSAISERGKVSKNYVCNIYFCLLMGTCSPKESPNFSVLDAVLKGSLRQNLMCIKVFPQRKLVPCELAPIEHSLILKVISYLGILADNTLLAYSLRYFWNVVASDNRGGPVLN